MTAYGKTTPSNSAVGRRFGFRIAVRFRILNRCHTRFPIRITAVAVDRSCNTQCRLSEESKSWPNTLNSKARTDGLSRNFVIQSQTDASSEAVRVCQIAAALSAAVKLLIDVPFRRRQGEGRRCSRVTSRRWRWRSSRRNGGMAGRSRCR